VISARAAVLHHDDLNIRVHGPSDVEQISADSRHVAEACVGEEPVELHRL
jgi:hypothetical protein